jgi:hypothetical protein
MPTVVKRLLSLVLLCSQVWLLPACRLLPVAQGLASWSQLQHLQNAQQQVEMFWRHQSFSFLLYQQLQPDYLQVLGLSMTGQILFELHYDGNTVKVVQRINAMKYLPFDYLLRDILWASLPSTAVAQAIIPVGLQLTEQQQIRQIWQQQRLLLEVHYSIDQAEAGLQIDNFPADYRLLLSPAKDDFLH